MRDLINYLKNPVLNSSKAPRIKYFLFLFFIDFLAAFVFSFCISFIRKHFDINHIVLGLTRRDTILFGVIFAPITEEVIFRSLLRFKKINIILFIITLTAYVAIAAFHFKTLNVILALFILISFIILLTTIPTSKIESFISSKFKYFFYGTSLIFGLLHIFNFTGNLYLMLAFLIILTAPQIVGGLILGYIRMNYGLVYSILFHITGNGFIIILLSHNM